MFKRFVVALALSVAALTLGACGVSATRPAPTVTVTKTVAMPVTTTSTAHSMSDEDMIIQLLGQGLATGKLGASEKRTDHDYVVVTTTEFTIIYPIGESEPSSIIVDDGDTTDSSFQLMKDPGETDGYTYAINRPKGEKSVITCRLLCPSQADMDDGHYTLDPTEYGVARAEVMRKITAAIVRVFGPNWQSLK